MAYKRPSRRKYHFIYETRCLVTGKFYRGKHSTDDLEDGYLGSGVWIRRGVKAHGKDRYERTILEFCSYEELDAREIALIDAVNDNNLCMNIAKGGEGGYTGVSSDHLKQIASIGGLVSWKDNILLTQTEKAKAKKTETKRANGTLVKNFTTKGFSYSKESKLKMSMSSRGDKNSQHGTCWITDGKKPFKIKKELLQEYLDKGYLKGRKIWNAHSNPQTTY